MRISTGQIYNSALNSLLDQQAQVARTQQQIASGKRILTPADDPAGTASLLGINQSMQITRQHQENITAARSQLGQEESTLGAVNRLLDRVRELALQANNAPLTGPDRRAIAIEVRQQFNDLLGLANTMTPGGEYLFAGYQGRTQPFSIDAAGNAVYHGDGGQRLVQVGPNRQVAVNDGGVDVFVGIPRGNGSFAVLADGGNSGVGVISRSSVTGAYGGEGYTVRFPLATAASVPLAFDDAGGNDDLGYELSINGVAVYSVNASGTPAATLDELADAINLESAATGVRAVVDGDALYLVHENPPGQDITVSETLLGASDGDADSVTGYFGSVLTGASAASADLNYSASAATRYLVEDANGQFVASGDYADRTRLVFGGIELEIDGLPRSGDVFTVEPAASQDVFATIGNLLRSLEAGDSGTALGNVVNEFLLNVDQAMENVRAVRADVGSRLKALDVQEELNEDALLRLDTSRSTLEDLDYAEALSRFSLQMVGLEAAQKSFVQIQGLSLFNYL